MRELQLVRKVADGSAVEAFLGRSPRGNVLVQVSRPELLEDSELYGRFLDTTKQIVQRSHPGLLSAAQAHCGSDGRFFVVSQPVPGSTAEDWLRTRGPLRSDTAVTWGVGLSEALQFLHLLGLVHGNLAPNNVYLDGDPDAPMPRLLDTGLLLFRAGRSLPAPGVLVRPEYLSPERVAGHRATPASDVYGLGVLLFELLTGHPPFSDRDAHVTRQLHLSNPAPRMPLGLEAWTPLLGRCLAKRPEDRFANLLEVRQALLELSVDEPIVVGTALGPPQPTPPAPGLAQPPNPLEALERARGQTPAPDAAAPGPGTRLGSYRVEALLGEGGMGKVFLARHEVLGRKVALKVMRPELAARPDQVSRFVQEAQAVNRAAHPNIVQVFDLVREAPHEGGRVYFVMELLEGVSLKDEGRNRPFSLERALRVVREAAQALGAAHAVGVVHRDIKPDNLFLARGPDGVERVKVLDFGVARMADAATGPRATLAGQVVGTPLWMAPEQVLGHDADARTDLYALGTVLYVLLARRFPFAGRSMHEVVMERVAQDAQPLGERTALGEAVPEALRELVAACLARQPARRPASMAELVARLEAIEQSLGPSSLPPLSEEASAVVPISELLVTPREPVAAVAPPERAVARRAASRWPLAVGLLMAAATAAWAWLWLLRGG